MTTTAALTYINATITMRPRRASVNRRRTQIQVPIRLLWFFGTGVNGPHGDFHGLVLGHARGTLNTVKIEIPEIGKMTDPVLVFSRWSDGMVTYNAYDAATDSRGFNLIEALRAGFGTTTTTTLPAGKEEQATWYRTEVK